MGLGTRGISPVISTIIIVAVAVGITIGAAVWFGGLSATFQTTEELRITSAYFSGGTSGRDIVIDVRNTGSATVRIDSIYINAKPFTDYTAPAPNNALVNASASLSTVTLGPAATQRYVVSIPQNLVGTSVEIGVHTTSGNIFRTVVRTT